ncbi:MAG: hypothetical protein ACQEXJ_16545 [Myxococcota bacterium]
MKTWMPAAGAALLMVLVAGCDTGRETAPSTMEVHALSGGSCAEGASIDPLQDLEEVEVSLSRFDPEAEEGDGFEVIRSVSRSVSDMSFTLSGVPETTGVGHRIVLSGEGQQARWYAADMDVTVRRNTDNPVDLLLTRFGGFSCVPTDTSLVNAVFPAAAELGDGRLFISGGFTQLLSDRQGGTYLGAPSSQAFIFDPTTGLVDEVIDMGEGEGRAGHAVEFIPSPTGEDRGKVLILGGMTRLGVDSGAGFPFTFDKEDGRRDFLLYDLSTSSFVEGTDDAMQVKRGFPRTHLMADGTVVVTGGGQWPQEASTDYQEVEVFDPQQQAGAWFVPGTAGFISDWPRTGHSLSFLGNTPEQGLTQLLVWGGTTPPGQRKGTDSVAEIMTQSSQQVEGIDGSFSPVTVQVQNPDDGVPFTFFHEMTPLGEQDFLLTGGVRAQCAGQGQDCTLRAPAADEAWHVHIQTGGDDPVAQVRKVPGMGAGRVFHSAHLSAPGGVAVVGGLAGTNAVQTDKIMLFDEADSSWAADPAGGDRFEGRGAHLGVTLGSRAALLVGGETNLTDLDGNTGAFVEVFAPSNLHTP